MNSVPVKEKLARAEAGVRSASSSTGTHRRRILWLVNGKKPESSTLKSKKERRNKSICLEILEPFAAKKAAGMCRLLFSNCINTVGRGSDWNFTS